MAFTADVDSADLRQKMNELSLEFQVVKQENATLKKKSNKHCEEKEEALEKVRDSEIVISNLHQRVEFLNKQVKSFSAIEEELRICKDKLKLMDNDKRTVNATHQEVEEKLQQYEDQSETAKTHTLSRSCDVLKQKIEECQKLVIDAMSVLNSKPKDS